MKSVQIKQLRHSAFLAADRLIRAAKAAGKDLAGSELQQYNEHLAEVRRLDDQINQSEGIPTGLDPTKARPTIEHSSIPRVSLPSGGDLSETAFNTYVRTGILADANLSPSSDGGVLIPETLFRTLTHREAGFRPMEGVSRVIATEAGEPMVFPRVDDTVAGEYLAASASTGNAAPPSSLDAVTLAAFKASSKPVAVSRELLTDAGFDVGSEIVAVLLARTGRLLNASYTAGLGVAEPTGFLTGCTLLEAAGATLTLDDALGLIYAIAAQRRNPKNVFVMSSVTQKFLRSLKTGITNDQTPLWQESPVAGEPPRLYGHSVIINDAMPDVGTAGAVVKNCIAFGDFSGSFLIRRAGPAYILRYPIPQSDETGFIVFERADSKLLMPEGIAALDVNGN